jgi:hypothetical protein
MPAFPCPIPATKIHQLWQFANLFATGVHPYDLPKSLKTALLLSGGEIVRANSR